LCADASPNHYPDADRWRVPRARDKVQRKLRFRREEKMIRSAAVLAACLFVATPALAQQTTPPKLTVLVKDAAATGRHTHPGDEYGTVVEGTVMTRQGEGDWRTVEAGQNYYVAAGIIHETKNAGDKPARTYNAWIAEKGKPLATPAP
jgi:mannose-6-phosphate isomerase-like protein (cupin superfamily)